jgi:hypothetical protein
MKPLVYWCRWNEATLRLHGRSATDVWGELVFESGTRPFTFNLKSWDLVLGAGETAQTIRLDEMGVAVTNGESP